ncbi:MAG: UDP-N-acetylmuramoyl-L-alanyl-D-glutamate--2,6-diaminopimelate ligase [Thermonemataceae bacterium]
MKQLQELLKDVAVEMASPYTTQAIQAVHFDSRLVVSKSLFVALHGTRVDGHDFITQAIEKGATAVVCQELPASLVEGVAYIKVKDTTKALGVIAANFYDHPSRKLQLVAVTGTNGKTTTVTLLYKLFRSLGYSTGLLSTIQNQINEEVIPATHTTPDALQINQLLAKMVKQGCTHCFMEASSHAIALNRIAGLYFAGAVFTNISHDHLDFHGSFANYIQAKKKLFDDLPKQAFALTNIDDKRGEVMLQNTVARRYTFALHHPAYFKGKLLDNTLQGLLLEINRQPTWFKLLGNFNAYNLLSVFATAMLLGEEEEEVLRSLSGLSAAPGRFEKRMAPNGIMGIVEYAHTPDALENVLHTLQGVRQDNQQIICVVGCGGDRDKTKRPLMAKVACQLSHQVIFTADNPRTEPPEAIIQAMLAGLNPIDKKKVQVIAERRAAIRAAVTQATPQDIILIAGKGHETYQEINGVRHHFDDREEIEKAFAEMAEKK